MSDTLGSRPEMSDNVKVESAANDVKALATRCKALEAQLRQSVPKRDHNEIVSKLEREISSLEKDLGRSKAENQKTVATNKMITDVESQISSLMRATGGLAKTLDSLDATATTTRKAIAEQARAIDGIGGRISQGTVPSTIYQESLAKIEALTSKSEGLARQVSGMISASEYLSQKRRLEEANRKISEMVPASDLEEANKRIAAMVPASDLEEANRRISEMVPASELAAMRRRADDLEATMASMVSRDQLAASESRVAELQGMLAYKVPQTAHDDRASRAFLPAEPMTVEESSPTVPPSEPAVEPKTETASPAMEPVTIEAEPAKETEVTPQAPEPVPEVVAEPAAEQPQVEVPAPAEAPVEHQPAPAVVETPEIREVHSQLAELGSQAQEARPIDVPAAPATATPASQPEPAAADQTPEPQAVTITTMSSEAPSSERPVDSQTTS